MSAEEMEHYERMAGVQTFLKITKADASLCIDIKAWLNFK